MDLVTKSLNKLGSLNRLACKLEKPKEWQALLLLCSEQSYTRVSQWAIAICCKDSLLTIYQPVNECIYRFSRRVYLSWSMQRVWLNLTWVGSWGTSGTWAIQWCTTWARVVQWTFKLWTIRGTGSETVTNRRWCTNTCRSQQWRNNLRSLATQFFWTLNFRFCWPRNWCDWTFISTTVSNQWLGRVHAMTWGCCICLR